ncbi:hypothetical protein HispidOSU_019008 [Sigmodon hispidus]
MSPTPGLAAAFRLTSLCLEFAAAAADALAANFTGFGLGSCVPHGMVAVLLAKGLSEPLLGLRAIRAEDRGAAAALGQDPRPYWHRCYPGDLTETRVRDKASLAAGPPLLEDIW